MPRSRASQTSGRLAAVAMGICLWFCLSIGVAKPKWYPFGTDYMAFHAGGYLAIHPGELYSLEQQYEIERSFGMPATFETMPPFLYPPFVALFFAPLSTLSFVPAFWSWLVLLLSMYLAGVYIWSRQAGMSDTVVPMALGGLGFLPIVYSLIIGQVTALIFLVTILALVAFSRGQDARGGAWIGFLAFKPQIVLIWGLVLLASRRWRAAGWAVFVGLGLAAAATIIFGPRIWLDYRELIGRVNAAGPESYQLDVAAMTSWRGWLSRVTVWEPSRVNVVAAILGIPVLAATLLAWRNPWRPRSEEFAWQVASTLLAILIVSPHSHIQDTALLWIGALWLTAATRSLRFCWMLVVVGSTVFLMNIAAIGGSFLTPVLVLLWLATMSRCRRLQIRYVAPADTMLPEKGER